MSQHFELGDEIARGGMGRIVRAKDTQLGREVAIKQLLATDDPETRARFEREARITARLAHPSIVSVHAAGTSPTGEPYFVMELVRGESLDKVIAARATLEARIGLIANVIAAVDALAYAHSQRVIHRDLKPNNVLVGTFGETVVIDWGLAKDLDHPEDAAATPTIRRPVPASAATVTTIATDDTVVKSEPGAISSDGGLTVDGAVMGTPAYMPAEQALGDKLDERADVYALGALLYHVLAGALPYPGKTTEEILVAVLAGPPPPLATRVQGVPPELVTIVAKAMAYDRRDRYATARGLADDLKRFQTGQLVGAHRYSTWALARRFIGRHRAAFAIGSVAVAALAIGATLSVRRIIDERALAEDARAAADEQRAIADTQKRAAETSRAEAEAFVSFMMVEMRDKLEPLGKLALLDAMAHKAVDYYKTRTAPATETEAAGRAQAHSNIGDVLRAEGDITGALAEFSAARALRESLAAAKPDSTERKRYLQIVMDRIGDVLVARHDTKGAIAVYSESLAIAEAIAAREQTPLARRDVSVSENKLGDVQRLAGDYPGALVRYERALAIREELARQPGHEARAMRDLSASYDRVATTYLDQKDTARALPLYEKSLAIAETLAAADTSNRAQQDLAISAFEVGQARAVLKDIAGARAAYDRVLAIRRRMAAGDLENADWQRALFETYTAIGDLAVDDNHPGEGLASYTAALGIARTLAAKDATDAERRGDLADALANLARVEHALGQDALADAHRAEAAALRPGQQLPSTSPKAGP